MTITYTGKVSNARLWAFSRLLGYWKGSIYKLMYKEMMIFCTLYATLSLVYRLALTESQKRIFERIVLHCETFVNLIPLSFVLGFYVSICVQRWWSQYLNIPWPDRIMMYVSTMIDGVDERSRVIRRTIMRYLSVASLIVFQATSVVVKKRFPTMDHLIEAGVIYENEVKEMNKVNTPHGKWWVPIVWICNIIKEARKEGRIADDYLMKTLIDEVQAYRGNLGTLFSYDWISVPLVYTQVTTLAVYTFFLGSVLGRQFLDPAQGYKGHDVDLFVPVFTVLQFFFYMGWLKVAEQLINPFGEDDDDFEINWILDRNYQVSLIVADDLCGQIPKMQKDTYFGENPPDCLPYTKSSVNMITQPHMGSTADVSISEEGMQVVNLMETIQENVEEEDKPSDVLQSHTPSVPVCSPYQTVSHQPSPVATPHHGRRHLIPNMITGCHTPGMHTPYSLSKSTLDSYRPEKHGINARHLVQTLNGHLTTKFHAYFDQPNFPESQSRSCVNSVSNHNKHGLSPLSLSVEHMKPSLGLSSPTSNIDIPSASFPNSRPPIYNMGRHQRDTSVSSNMHSIDCMATSMESDNMNLNEDDGTKESSCRIDMPSTDNLANECEDNYTMSQEQFDIFAVPDADQAQMMKERQAMMFNIGKSTSDLSTVYEKPERERHLSGHSSGSSNFSADVTNTSSTTPLLKIGETEKGQEKDIV